MATVFKVWGVPPPSVWNALTPQQRRSLDRYINLKIVSQCYRLAYDIGYDAGFEANAKPLKKLKLKPRVTRKLRHPSPNTEDAG